jgi:hypothetical protein
MTKCLIIYTCIDVYTALVTKSTYEKTFKNIQLFSQSIDIRSPYLKTLYGAQESFPSLAEAISELQERLQIRAQGCYPETGLQIGNGS